MGIKLNSLKCPECAATISVEEGRTQCFCSYCGAKIAITNENEFVYRNVDEADVKRAETDRTIKLHKMKFHEKMTKTKLVIGIISGILGILFFILGFISDESDSDLSFTIIGMFLLFASLTSFIGSKDENDDIEGGIKIPSSVFNYEKKNFAAVQAILLSAGFKNVQCIPLNDLTMGLLKRPGSIESITINGKENYSTSKKFSPDASIIISYHSFPQKNVL